MTAMTDKISVETMAAEKNKRLDKLCANNNHFKNTNVQLKKTTPATFV